MFKSIPLDAKFDDIKDCFDQLKYVFPPNCKIKISLLEEGENKEKERLNEEKLSKAVQRVLVNGVITGQAKEELVTLKQKLDISQEMASGLFSEEVLKKIIRDALTTRTITNTGKKAWEKIRKKLDIPVEEASRLFSEEFLREIIKGVLSDSTTSEAKNERLRGLRTKLNELGISPGTANRIFEEEKSKIQPSPITA